ncbi:MULTISPECIES: carbamoyl-phosphate synthase domain-containing protein [Actinomyces]|uniref:Carbamoyl-phosphate synthase small subunit N-terminal domain-containing protein n=1 Tax=Actinomyces respiraculi TaxID=2744574 RepID=A0A7T0LN07_9ACTO|nr:MULTISPECIES: carbamoyl-phosphate synthase domain-containing protein [Actinomyces]QPL06446.1 hypothetical protein ID810_06050 [Actinomyces respiraculi]
MTTIISTVVRRGADRGPALLILEDGFTLTGRTYGATGLVAAPVTVTTAVTGYQEILTDPANAERIVLFTAPHVGNTGTNDDDARSAGWATGVIVREPARRASSWLARRELEDDLVAAGVVGICRIDTRALTRHLRDHGPLRAAVVSGDALPDGAAEASIDVTALFATAAEES